MVLKATGLTRATALSLKLTQLATFGSCRVQQLALMRECNCLHSVALDSEE
jgi:hypothetical protein